MDMNFARTLLTLPVGETVKEGSTKNPDRVWKRTSENYFKSAAGRVDISAIRLAAYGDPAAVAEVYGATGEFRAVIRKLPSYSWDVQLFRYPTFGIDQRPEWGKPIATFGPYEGGESFGDMRLTAFEVAKAVLVAVEVGDSFNRGPTA